MVKAIYTFSENNHLLAFFKNIGYIACWETKKNIFVPYTSTLSMKKESYIVHSQKHDPSFSCTVR